ncbi:21974_t:CDS:2 [Dentiscutata erythropus]|uniref:21974_t:CDS:1 n=1 Tax=Dentiscutata erythropus TaxID=1348616 RepID=A0A9N9DYN3_9GLOM|nr:21974_t:CDS:2 [Dentiscutata erythropus]
MLSEEFLPSYLRNSPINKRKKNVYKSKSLPTHWNSMDCWPYINVIDQNGLNLKYNGPGRENNRHNLFLRCIGIGYCKSDVELNVLPGWVSDSIGYHGDDGRLYYGRGNGKMFGPCYATGDTIDDLINYELVGEMYPMCGMAINGECISANFGTKPFVFDIDNYAEVIFADAESKE